MVDCTNVGRVHQPSDTHILCKEVGLVRDRRTRRSDAQPSLEVGPWSQ
jgi:hypothetical protein